MEETKHNGETKNSITSSLIWKFSERVLAQVVSFIVSIILARMLVPDDFGVIALVMIFIVFADVFVTSGFSTSLIQKRDANKTDFSTIFYCSFVVSVILYIVLFFAAPAVSRFFKIPALTPVLRVLGLRIPISSYNSIQHAYVSRHMMFRKFFFSTLFGTIVSGILGVAAAFAGFGVWALVIQYLTNIVVDTICLSFTVKWHPSFVFSKNAAKELMSFGWKVLLADLSGVFFDQLRSLVIGRFFTTADLAYYNRGKSFSSLVMDNISNTVMAVLFPALSNENTDVAKVKALLRKAVSMMSYIIFPIIGGMVVVASPMVKVLLTSKWDESIPFLQILCVAAAISMIGNVSLQAIKAIGRSDILLKLEIIKKPIYLVLLVLGLRISTLYVAITMLIYSVYSTFVNVFPLNSTLDYSFKEQLKDLSVPFALTLAMCLPVYLLGFVIGNQLLLLLTQIAVGIAVYIALSKLFHVVYYDDLKARVKAYINR